MELEEELSHLDSLILQMSGVVEKNLFYAFDVYLNYDQNKYYPEVDDLKVNAYERWIEADALHLMLKERLYASDLRVVTGIMSMVQDIERLGDHAKDILEFALKLKKANNNQTEIKDLIDFVIQMVKDSVKSYIDKDENLARNVILRDDHVDETYAKLIDELIEMDEGNKIDSAFSIYTSLVVKYIERIADHATNVAEWVIYIMTGYYKDKQIIQEEVMRTIYSVEDDTDIAKIIYVSLSKAGYRVLSFPNTKEFWLKFKEEKPDLILLDLMLPDGNGMDVLRTIRADSLNNNVKVIILSAKRMTMDKVDGLDSGADDYIEKPFDILELISRVNARFRLDHDNLIFQDIELDMNRHICLYQGTDINLTNTEFEILHLLMRNLSKAVSREEIFHKIYSQDEPIESRAIDMHVASLRKKLNDKGNHIIRTIYGVGYIIG